MLTKQVNTVSFLVSDNIKQTMNIISIPTSNDYSQWYDKPFYVDKT
jgi:hypothetical protein